MNKWRFDIRSYYIGIVTWLVAGLIVAMVAEVPSSCVL